MNIDNPCQIRETLYQQLQLTLPFRVATKLPQSQIIKLLGCQCKILQFNSQDISSINIFCENNPDKIINVLALLYEYAGFLDEIRILSSKLNATIDSTTKYFDLGDLDNTFRSLLKTLLFTLRFYYLICHWRKLQWNPLSLVCQTLTFKFPLSVFIQSKITMLKDKIISTNSNPQLTKYLESNIPREIFALLGETIGNNSFNNNSNLDFSAEKIIHIIQEINYFENLIISKNQEKDHQSEKFTTLYHLRLPLFDILQYPKETLWFASSIANYSLHLNILDSLMQFLKVQFKTNKLFISHVDVISEVKSETFIVFDSNDSFRLISLNPIVFDFWEEFSFPQQNRKSEGECISPLVSPDSSEESQTQCSSFGQAESKNLNDQSEVVESESYPLTPVPEFNPLLISPQINRVSSPSKVLSVSSIRTSSTYEENDEEKEESPIFYSTPSFDSEYLSPSQPAIETNNLVSSSLDVSRYSSPQATSRHRTQSADMIFSQSSKKVSTRSRPRFGSDPFEPTYNNYISKKVFHSRSNDTRAATIRDEKYLVPLLRQAIQQMGKKGRTIEDRAVNKIIAWYRIIAPRRKLLRRLATRDIVLDSVSFIIDRTFAVITNCQRRRTRLLRQGAASKLLTFIRNWLNVQKLKKKKKAINLYQDVKPRNPLTEEYLSQWQISILNGIRIYRYIKYIRKNIVQNVKYPHIYSKNLSLARVLELYLIFIHKAQFQLQIDEEERVNLAKKQLNNIHPDLLPTSYRSPITKSHSGNARHLSQSLSSSNLTRSSAHSIHQQFPKSKATMVRRNSFYTDNSCVLNAIQFIQKLVRKYLKRKREQKEFMLNTMSSRITLFILCCNAKYKRKALIRSIRSIIKIQRLFRGAKIRKELYATVRAGLRLNELWRKHMAYKNLKAQLRRVDRPHTIIVHGLKNISEKVINNGLFKFKLSVWWNPLLHIVGKHDFNVVLNSKQPQLYYESSVYRLSNKDYNSEKQKEIEKPQIDTINPALKLATSKLVQNSNSRTSIVNMDKKVLNDQNIARPNELPQIQSSPSRSPSKVLLSSRNRGPRSSNVVLDSSGQSLKGQEIDKREPDEGSNSPNSKVSVVRKTLSLAIQLGNKVSETPGTPSNEPQASRLFCNFNDEIIKIPGCHGNSVFKFEIFDGDRRLGQCFFYLRSEGELMYWGGEYQEDVNLITHRRAVQFNSQIMSGPSERTSVSSVGSPTLSFRVIAGAPLRSRCQWARLLVKGSGPFKRLLQGTQLFSSLNPFETWNRFYLSLDEFGLFFFENKFYTKEYFKITIQDLKNVHVEIGTPSASAMSGSKNIVEDINNVVLTTIYNDVIYMRFPDASSRVAWVESFTNAIQYLKKKSSVAVNKSPWGMRSTLAQMTNKMSLGEMSPLSSPLTKKPDQTTSPFNFVQNLFGETKSKVVGLPPLLDPRAESPNLKRYPAPLTDPQSPLIGTKSFSNKTASVIPAFEKIDENEGLDEGNDFDDEVEEYNDED